MSQVKWPNVMAHYPNPRKLREQSLKDGLSVADGILQEAMVKSAQIKTELTIASAESKGMLDITSYGQAWISDNVLYLADNLLHKPTTEVVKSFINFPSKLRLDDQVISTDTYLNDLRKYRADGIKYVPNKDEAGAPVELSDRQIKINTFVTEVSKARSRSLTVAFIVLSEVLSSVMSSDEEGTAPTDGVLATNVSWSVISNVLQQLLVLRGPELKKFIEVPSVPRILLAEGFVRKRDSQLTILGKNVLGALGIQSINSISKVELIVEGRKLLESACDLLSDISIVEGRVLLSEACLLKMNECRYRTVSSSCEARPVLERPISDGLYNSYKNSPIKDFLIGGGSGLELTETDRRAIDRIQGTPFRVNRQLLSVVRKCVDMGLSVSDKLGLDEVAGDLTTLADFPVRGDMSLMDYSAVKRDWFADLGNKERYDQWCFAREQVLSSRSGAISINDSNLRTLEIAQWYADWGGVFYLPVFLDYRTRMYYMPTIFNPQANKLAKALFIGGQGRALGTEEALESWLVSWGNTHAEVTDSSGAVYAGDKSPLDVAIKYCRGRLSVGARIASDPIKYFDEWSTQEEPFAFLAHCFECEGILRDGLGAVSSIFISMDGSCNAYQHASGYLGDKSTGSKVNLGYIPRDKVPADMYRAVSENYLEHLTDAVYDKLFKFHGVIGRSTCKRIVMCLGYGLTKTGAVRYGMEEMTKVKGIFAGLGINKKVLGEASELFAQGVLDGVARVAPAVIKVKDALQSMGSLACQYNKDGVVSWKSYNGTVLSYTKYRSESVRINRVVGNKRLQFNVNLWTDKVDEVEVSNAFAPNYTHSRDADHMRLAINKMPENCMYLVIHDSFGTLACDAPLFKSKIKESFREMYEGKDPLAELFDLMMVPVLQFVGVNDKIDLVDRLDALKGDKSASVQRSVCRKLIKIMENIKKVDDIDWDQMMKSVYDFR